MEEDMAQGGHIWRVSVDGLTIIIIIIIIK